MRRLLTINIFLLIILVTTACSATKQSTSENPGFFDNQWSKGYIEIKPEEAKKRLENEKSIILLDVRTVEEYSERHIPKSILIPVNDIEKKAPGILTDKNAEIFVYCRSGKRSVTASQALVKMGYKRIYNLGGIIDWPFETETGAPNN